MQSSLDGWNSTHVVETVHNNTYMETERRQKRMLSVEGYKPTITIK